MPQSTPRSRSDIAFGEVVDGAFEVRDPIRSTIFEFNSAQRSIYLRLNGSRTVDEVADLVSEEFEVEIPSSDVEEFLGFLRRHFLLEVCEYDLNEAALVKRIARNLKKTGTVQQAWSIAGAIEGASDGKLSRSLAALESGDINEAVALLLSEDGVSAAILASIRTEFLSSRNKDDDVWKWSLGNPDRALTAVDSVVGRWLYHPVGALALVALFGIAIFGAFGATLPSPSEFSWLDGVLGYSLKYVFTLFGHELLGHGLAAKHFGGHVTDIGATLRNRTSVVLYCDVSDALHAGQSRRAKLHIFLGGVVVDLIVASIIITVFTLALDLRQAPRPLLVALVFVLFSVVENAMPLRGHDGCWAVAAALNLRDLWLGEKAHLYWRRRLGFAEESELDGITWSPREESIYRIFGVVEIVAMLTYFIGLWLILMAPFLYTYLGGVGLLIAAVPTTGFVRMRIWPLLRGSIALSMRRKC